jgi:hypothetical protein
VGGARDRARRAAAGGDGLSRETLEQLEGVVAGDDLLAVLAWLAAPPVEEAELRGAVRRAVLLVAAGGDPHRGLALDGRAVTALAVDLDSVERRAALRDGLAALDAEAEGLGAVGAALTRLLADDDLAWRALAAGLLADELSD